jgi:hypothetical protein
VETFADLPLSSRTATATRTLVGRAPGGDAAGDHALLPRFAWQAMDGSIPSPVNPDPAEQRGLPSRLQGITATSIRPINITIYRCAYSRAIATFSSMAGTKPLRLDPSAGYCLMISSKIRQKLGKGL